VADEEHAAIKKEIEFIWKDIGEIKMTNAQVNVKLDQILEYVNKSKGNSVWVDKLLWFIGTGIVSVLTYFAAMGIK
jgi:hypothetical protein